MATVNTLVDKPLFYRGTDFNNDVILQIAKGKSELRSDSCGAKISHYNPDELLKELLQIEQALRAGAPMIPDKYIKTGQKCRVMAGPLLGLQGIVVKTRGTTRLVLQVDMLGQAASVEIDIDMIEVID